METALEQITPDRLQGLTAVVPPYEGGKEANDLIVTARTLKAVTNQDEHALAIRYASDCAGQTKKIKAHFDPYCKSAKALHSAIVELRDKPSRVLDAEKDRLSWLALGYQQQIEREQREARRLAEEEERARRDAEQKKIEEAAQLEREALEDERRQLAEIAREQAAAGNAAAAAEAKRMASAAEFEEDRIARQTAAAVEDLQAEPINTDYAVGGAAPKARDAGASARVDYIVDEESVDLFKLAKAAVENWPAFGRFLSLNLSAAKSEAKLSKGKTAIPGVTVREKRGMSIRASV